MTLRNLSLLSAIAYVTATASTTWQPMRTDATLWYDAPARQWEETVPLGNGRLGMMPDGGIDSEKIVLNEISMWSGMETDYSNPKAAECLPQIQQLLFEGKNWEAQELMYKSFVPTKPEKGGTYGAYQMLADIDINYTYPSHHDISDYHRWLDLTEAIAYTSYNVGDISYLREYYVPRGHDVIVMHISANKSHAIDFTLKLQRKECVDTVSHVSPDIITISGNLDSGKEGVKGVSYEAALRVMVSGDKSTIDLNNDGITVSHADDAWIAVAATTDYWERTGLNVPPAPIATLEDLTPSTLAEYRQSGISNHRSLYGRAGINLSKTEQSSLPTNLRIEAFQNGADPELAALYYNYGRYLLISSTLPGLLPPNLQGLWANECGTPWNGDYHTNINVQMNHWPAEQSNLSELHQPLIKLTERAVPSGERTAKAFYGDNAKGWVMHMMTNVWNYTEPGEHPSWGATNTGGAWLCAHLWEHHLFNPTDTAYLREIYPVMKGASEFFLTTMVSEPKHGWLVTAPSSSPENKFMQDGQKVSVCMAPTMDTQIVHELFTNVITAAETLGVDEEYASKLKAALAKLPPMQIGSDGRLMEWLEEYEEEDPHHRHVSHLYGLHPSNLITPDNTPELANAARLTLETRGDGGTGWSRAWKINFWARLGDGNRAYTLFKALLAPAYTEAKPKHAAGTFPNLFCSHPPFQIDGNFGGTSGIGEMILQSHEGFINILPALPDAMSEGSAFGLKARGGATVNLTWENSLPKTIDIDTPTEVVIKLPLQIKTISVNGTPTPVINGKATLPQGKNHCEI